ncbi:hypothetical protein GCM10008994_22810 [Halorubrum ejinorense]|uniref:Uncharacterized protein n=1 Tax=Halorubrum ejinorense TaxID=425309 RepID=A0AAV3SU28_9EURY
MAGVIGDDGEWCDCSEFSLIRAIGEIRVYNGYVSVIAGKLSNRRGILSRGYGHRTYTVGADFSDVIRRRRNVCDFVTTGEEFAGECAGSNQVSVAYFWATIGTHHDVH